MSNDSLASLTAYLRAQAPAATSHAHAARLEAWAADVERVVAELAELHAMASAHNPTPPSPEVRAEHERRLAEILERIGPEKAWANLMEGIHARSRLSPDGRAEFDALWDRWDDERDPHEKAKLQMQLAEWCASLVSHGESADRECAELYNCEEHRPQDQPRVAGERHEHRPGSAGDDARRLRGATDPVVVATPPAAPSATEATRADRQGAIETQEAHAMTPAERKMTEAQQRTLTLASVSGRIVAIPGGYWVDALLDGTANVATRAAGQSAVTHSVYACTNRGWLRRTHKRVEDWLDPRELTEAGREALERRRAR